MIPFHFEVDERTAGQHRRVPPRKGVLLTPLLPKMFLAVWTPQPRCGTKPAGLRRIFKP
jgi:hypothetical protein